LTLYFVTLAIGASLDDALDALKAAAGNPRDPEPGPGPEDDGVRRDWNVAFGDIITGKAFHPALTPLAASFAAHGLDENVANKTLRALLLNTQTTDPDRLARRNTELGALRSTIKSGY
jgi:hypothetical protein